jgi:hypothetical protein
MVRVVNLTHTGLYVVLRQGALASVNGCKYWNSLDDVMLAMRQEQLPAAEHVIHTAR